MRLPIRHTSRFWRRMAYLGARHGPEPWLKYSPPLFGALFCAALPGARQRVVQNLKDVRGQVSRGVEWRQVLETFVNYAQCLAEGLAAERPRAARTECSVVGQEHLDTALEAGAGAVLITVHAGPWDAVARCLAETETRDVLMVMQRETDAQARALHDQVRRQVGLRVVHADQSPFEGLHLLRHLRSGGIVAAQLDRAAPAMRTIDARLFGRPRAMPEGVFRLSALSQAPLVPALVRREGFFRYCVRIYPPIRISRRPQRRELERAALAVASNVEAFVRECPTQWFDFG